MFRTWVRLPSSPLSKNKSARINILVDLFFYYKNIKIMKASKK